MQAKPRNLNNFPGYTLKNLEQSRIARNTSDDTDTTELYPDHEHFHTLQDDSDGTQIVLTFWSKKPEEKKGWWQSGMDNIKGCYTPGSYSAYYRAHRKVEPEEIEEDYEPPPSPPAPPPPPPPQEEIREAEKLKEYSKIPSYDYGNEPPTQEVYVQPQRPQPPLVCPRVSYHNTQLSAVFCCMTKILTAAFHIISIGAALYYIHKWWNMRQEYEKTIKEVREAQNDRILLEKELAKLQTGGNMPYDEIGDTKREVMLVEIARISEYLREAKEEIANLMEEKDKLKTELRQAIQERNTAKNSFDHAVKVIVKEEENNIKASRRVN